MGQHDPCPVQEFVEECAKEERYRLDEVNTFFLKNWVAAGQPDLTRIVYVPDMVCAKVIVADADMASEVGGAEDTAVDTEVAEEEAAAMEEDTAAGPVAAAERAAVASITTAAAGAAVVEAAATEPPSPPTPPAAEVAAAFADGMEAVADTATGGQRRRRNGGSGGQRQRIATDGASASAAASVPMMLVRLKGQKPKHLPLSCPLCRGVFPLLVDADGRVLDGPAGRPAAARAAAAPKLSKDAVLAHMAMDLTQRVSGVC